MRLAPGSSHPQYRKVDCRAIKVYSVRGQRCAQTNSESTKASALSDLAHLCCSPSFGVSLNNFLRTVRKIALNFQDEYRSSAGAITLPAAFFLSNFTFSLPRSPRRKDPAEGRRAGRQFPSLRAQPEPRPTKPGAARRGADGAPRREEAQRSAAQVPPGPAPPASSAFRAARAAGGARPAPILPTAPPGRGATPLHGPVPLPRPETSVRPVPSRRAARSCDGRYSPRGSPSPRRGAAAAPGRAGAPSAAAWGAADGRGRRPSRKLPEMLGLCSERSGREPAPVPGTCRR